MISMNTALQIFTTIGGMGGFGAIIWLIADYVRKDEKSIQLSSRVDKVEARLDRLESTLVSHVRDISVSVARIESKLELDPHRP